jgi:hypothetical protein
MRSTNGNPSAACGQLQTSRQVKVRLVPDRSVICRGRSQVGPHDVASEFDAGESALFPDMAADGFLQSGSMAVHGRDSLGVCELPVRRDVYLRGTSWMATGQWTAIDSRE